MAIRSTVGSMLASAIGHSVRTTFASWNAELATRSLRGSPWSR